MSVQKQHIVMLGIIIPPDTLDNNDENAELMSEYTPSAFDKEIVQKDNLAFFNDPMSSQYTALGRILRRATDTYGDTSFGDPVGIDLETIKNISAEVESDIARLFPIATEYFPVRLLVFTDYS